MLQRFHNCGQPTPCIKILKLNLICSVISSSSSAQTQRAILHSRGECRHKSPVPQIGQALLSAIFLWRRRSFDGREHLASLHHFGRDFNSPQRRPLLLNCLSVRGPTDPARDLRCASILYDEQTEKTPCFSKCQAQKSCCCLVVSGILDIKFTSNGVKNSISFTRSQLANIESMNSLTTWGGLGRLLGIDLFKPDEGNQSII
jgi:hypothetical protein